MKDSQEFMSISLRIQDIVVIQLLIATWILFLRCKSKGPSGGIMLLQLVLVA